MQEELQLKGIIDIAELTPVAPDLYLWQGDITTLKCDGIVNAAKTLKCLVVSVLITAVLITLFTLFRAYSYGKSAPQLWKVKAKNRRGKQK